MKIRIRKAGDCDSFFFPAKEDYDHSRLVASRMPGDQCRFEIKWTDQSEEIEMPADQIVPFALWLARTWPELFQVEDE